MPGRDGKGKMGCGSKSGRGLGCCNGANSPGKGTDIGLGRRKNWGRVSPTDSDGLKTPKELLQEQKEQLESELEIISKQLMSL